MCATLVVNIWCWLTSNVVAEYAGGNDPAVGAEQVLEILLRHVLGQTADVEVRALYRLAARSRVRYLLRN